MRKEIILSSVIRVVFAMVCPADGRNDVSQGGKALIDMLGFFYLFCSASSFINTIRACKIHKHKSAL